MPRTNQYNNTEFLRFDSLEAGRYGFRVTFDDMVFHTTHAVNSEYFGLAWNAVAVPEPSGVVPGIFGFAVLFRRKRA
ncbi:MAG: hypothetical protein Q8Q59_00490 [Luteolibacter sp.]|jgi:hypothetical protein|nr:hypothetical protein [Luteolibacter sp.]